jgi:SpoU rRNA methylase family enzyme
LIDFAKIAYSSKIINYLVLTKVGGVAAQAGIPEVNRFAIKLGKSLIVLPELRDAIELLGPKKVFLVSGKGEKNISEIEIKNFEKVMIVIPGNELGFSKIEETMGENIKIDEISPTEIGPVGILSILLYCVLNKSNR